MEIVGIGTDLVSVARIRAVWLRFGMAFARRILTAQEFACFQETAAPPASFLAKRFAAKEAVAKALGTGFRANRVLLTDIGVCHDPLGKPHLEFSGKTAQELALLNVTTTHLSVSDEAHYALAFVILGRSKSSMALFK